MSIITETPQENPTKVEITGDLNVTGKIQQGGNELLPAGSIIMWYGAAPAPKGWAICDGTNKTPDLRGRFVIGADEQFAYKSSGGAKGLGVQKTIVGSGSYLIKTECVTEVEYPPYCALYYIMKTNEIVK